MAAKTKVLVFARAPEAGAAKTRLIPCLGAAGAAALQGILIERALRTALAAGIGEVELWCAPTAQHAQFARHCRQLGIASATQCAGDLGARMLDASVTALGECARVIIIGTDCPALTSSELQSAARALEKHDAVVIPAEDGGYVLIGLRGAVPRLFEDIPWGGNDVMRITRERMRSLGWSWAELPASWDVDRPADFDRLAASGLIPNLQQVLAAPAR